ncbi:MAG: YHYH protein [Phycisphaerae bacterium]|nr:YHYH protein [Phycisphaerae bacterium]
MRRVKNTRGKGADMRMRTIVASMAMATLVATAGADSLTRLGCDGDATQDGSVNTKDILLVISDWGGSGGFDVDGDGLTGVPELLLVLEEWMRPCHPFDDNMSVTLDYAAGMATITGSGLANHVMGPFDGSTGCYNPNLPSALNDTWQIPLKPVVGNTSGLVYLDTMGKVAVSLNGVAFYNPYDAGGVDAPSTICMDDFNGHPSVDGRYHYHQAPSWSYSSGDTGHSGVVGYAIDGFPNYGPYEDAGLFAKDVTGSGALDACNGHTDGQHGYHYHSISYELDSSGFPWVQGCWYGNPVVSNIEQGGGGGCQACADNMIPPAVCNCVHTTPGYEYCCDNWDANCQYYADTVCATP